MHPVATHKTRATEVAYDAIEGMIATLQLVERTGLTRTPIREALMRLVAGGLIEQEPRRGMRVSEIGVAEHLILIDTRRVLERLIASGSARWATPGQRSNMVRHARAMVEAADAGDINGYMLADQHLDHVNHEACRNPFAVQAVLPMIVQCRRFWYAYQYEGDLERGAACHLAFAQGIAQGSADEAIRGADALMDYLAAFARKIIE